MDDIADILAFAENLICQATETYCSELQRRILIMALDKERKTYDQLADECGYSPRYVRQDVAPKLWQLISQTLDRKVTKANVRSVLNEALRNRKQQQAVDSAVPAKAPTSSQALLNMNLAASTAGDCQANILLVDDQPQNLRLLSELLEEQGYEVQQAIKGSVALQAIATHPPDLVLLDISLPEVDGYTICQQIKANPLSSGIPVIFISALDEPWDKVRAFSVGGSDYIAKPFKVVEVLARVQNQLKIQQLQQRLLDQNRKLQQAIQELQRLAAIDEFTQVASRRRLDAYLLSCWQQARAQQTPLTLMLTQVDNFNMAPQRVRMPREVSQALTPEDRRLYEIAQALQRNVQSSDSLVARYGTTTFAIVLPHQSRSEGEQIATRLMSQVRACPVRAVGSLGSSSGSSSQTKVSLCIGIVSSIPKPETEMGDFLEQCDRNLQLAKSKCAKGLAESLVSTEF